MAEALKTDAGPVKYRWVNGWEASLDEWNTIDRLCEARGWMPLGQHTTRLLIAEDRLGIAGFMAMEMVPHVGHFFLAPRRRGTGDAEVMADKMTEFLDSVKARGWVVVADNPVSAQLARERGMKQIEAPVFTTGGGV